MKFGGELITNVIFKEKILKLKFCDEKHNLFSTDWMEQFQLWDISINSSCPKIQNLTAEADKSKGTLPEVVSGGLDRCKKMSGKFGLKPNIQPVFKKKRTVLFASLNQINEELNRLEQIGELSKVEFHLQSVLRKVKRSVFVQISATVLNKCI